MLPLLRLAHKRLSGFRLIGNRPVESTNGAISAVVFAEVLDLKPQRLDYLVPLRIAQTFVAERQQHR